MRFLGSNGGQPVDESEKSRIVNALAEKWMIPFSWRSERREASSASSPSRKALASQSLQMQKSPSLLASQVTSFLGVHDIFRVKKTEFLPLFTTLPQLPNLDLYIHLALCCCASSPSPSRSTSTLSSTSFCSSLHLSRAARRPDDAHLSSSVSFSASRRTESCICGGGFRCTYTPREMYPDGNRNSPSPFSKLASCDSTSSSSSSAASSPSSAASSSSGSVSSPSLPPLREAVKALHPVPVGSFHAAAQALDQKFEGLLAAFSLEKSYFFCPSFFLCLPLQQVAARSSLVCGCAPSSRETGGGSASEQREAERRRRRNHAAGRQSASRQSASRQSASRQSASRQSASRGDREAKLCTERETQPTIGSANGDTGEKANRGETPPREEEETQTDYESTEDEADDGDAADCSGEEGVSFHDFLACEEGEENEESSLRKEERRFVWNYELMKFVSTPAFSRPGISRPRVSAQGHPAPSAARCGLLGFARSFARHRASPCYCKEIGFLRRNSQAPSLSPLACAFASSSSSSSSSSLSIVLRFALPVSPLTTVASNAARFPTRLASTVPVPNRPGGVLCERVKSRSSSRLLLGLIVFVFCQLQPGFFPLCANLSFVDLGSSFLRLGRYRKRGLSVAGDAANEVETEFVFYTYTPRRASAFPPSSSSSYSRPLRVFDFHLFSHVQVRGSVPTFWAQEATVLPAMPAIACTQTDVNASATRRHFASLFQRYGAPVHVLNLLKRRLPSSPSAAASSFSPSSDSACSLSANWREESGEEPQSARVSRQSRKSPCSFSPSPLVEEGDPAAFLASSDSCLRATKSSPDLPSGRGSSSFALPVEAAPHNGSSTVSSARCVDTPQPPGSSETSVSPVFASPVVSSLLRASSAELPRLSLASCASSSSASPPYASSSFSSSSSLHAAVGAAFAAGRKGAGYERREEQEGELSEVYRQLVDAMNEELPPSLRINFHWIDLKRQQYRRPIPHATPSASFPSAPPSACGEAFALEGRGAPACRLRWRAAKNVGMFSFPAQRLGRTASWHTGTPFAPCSDEWRQSFFDSREGDEQRAKAEERERERERDREEEETLTPYQQLQRLGDELMNTVGVFYTNDPITLAATSVQRGICRVNCLDCLDRTNDAQLVLYKNVLLHLLRVMRFIPADSLDLDPQVTSTPNQ
ncbi:SacI homology domain-containing protein, partial [Toxoplasma gondii VAND]